MDGHMSSQTLTHSFGVFSSAAENLLLSRVPSQSKHGMVVRGQSLGFVVQQVSGPKGAPQMLDHGLSLLCKVRGRLRDLLHLLRKTHHPESLHMGKVLASLGALAANGAAYPLGLDLDLDWPGLSLDR
eukprot:5949726-Prorocentrum_lima.AAC.1